MCHFRHVSYIFPFDLISTANNYGEPGGFYLEDSQSRYGIIRTAV